MVDLPRIMLSQNSSRPTQESERIEAQRDLGGGQREAFREIFEQSIAKTASLQSGKNNPKYGEILPENTSALITMESKKLPGGMVLIVGGDEPTNEVLEEFAQSQGIEAELLALLMKSQPTDPFRREPAIDLPKVDILQASEKALAQEAELGRGLETVAATQPFFNVSGQEKILIGANPVNEGSESLTQLNKTPYLQAADYDMPNSFDLPKVDLLQASEKALVQEAELGRGLETVAATQPFFNVSGQEKILIGANPVYEGSESLTQLNKTPYLQAADYDTLNSLLASGLKDSTTQNNMLTARLNNFIGSDPAHVKEGFPIVQLPQNSNNLGLAVIPEAAHLVEEYNDTPLLQTKNTETFLAVTETAGKRISIELPEALSMTKQEQHSYISRRLAEALGQRLATQVSKGVWQVELDIHPKALGRIEIHLEMRGGELEAQFNASKALTRELLQEGLPRLKEELREHGIKTAYLGLGSGKQQENGGNSTPSDKEKNGNETGLHAKAVVLEPKTGEKQQNLSDGLDVSI